MTAQRLARNPFSRTRENMVAPSSHDVRRALIWRSGGQATAQLLLWASTFIVIRLLAPSDYGLIAMAAVVTGFLGLLAGQGFTVALIQAPVLDLAQARRFLGLLILVNLALAATQFTAAPVIAGYYGTPAVATLLRVQSFAYLLIPWVAVPAALAQREMDFRTPALIDFTGSVAGALATLALALAHQGVWALIAGQLAPLIMRAVVWTARGRTPLPSFDLTALGRMAHFGGAVTLNGILWFAYAQADVLIAGRRLSAHEVGLYSTALFLAALPISKLLPVLNEVGLSAYARLAHDRAAVADGFLKVARLTSLAAFPIFFGLAAVAPALVPSLLGPQWTGSVPIVRLLSLAMPLFATTSLFGSAINALGRPRVQLGNALFGLAIMPAAFWLGSRHGAVGIAAAWALAYPLLFAISATRSLRVIGLSRRALAAALAPATLASALMAIFVLALARAGASGTILLAAGIPGGALVYAATIALVFPARLREAIALARPQAAM